MRSRKAKKTEVKKPVVGLKIDEAGEVNPAQVKTTEVTLEKKAPETLPESPDKTPTESSTTSKEEISTEAETEENIPVAEVKVEEDSSSLVRSIILVVIGVFVGAATATAIIIFYNKMIEPKQKITVPSPTVAVSPAQSEEKGASDSGKITDDLALYDIKVLNGSGKGGEAGRTEKLLKAKGYSVLEIGNADKSDYTKTIIQAKKKVPQTFLDNLKKVLTEQFEIDEAQTLDDKEQTEIIVIVGSSSSAKPSPEPTISLKKVSD